MTTAFMGSLLCSVVGLLTTSCAHAGMAKASEQVVSNATACSCFMTTYLSFHHTSNSGLRRKCRGASPFRRRPPGFSQPDAPCERTDIRAGRGNLTNVVASGQWLVASSQNGTNGAIKGSDFFDTAHCRTGASRRGTKQIQEPERYCTAFVRKSSLLSAGIRLRFITRAVAVRISVASTMIFTSHSSPMSTPSRTKPSWH